MVGPTPASPHTNGSSTPNGHAGDLGTGQLNGHAPTVRRELVLALRTAGPSSPDQLAALVGASRTGVLQQLRVLETDGLVSRRTERHGVGRPRHLYDVTASAQQLFPTNYDGLAAGLIAAIETIGGRELVDRVFETRRAQTAERIRRRLDESVGRPGPLPRARPRAGGHPGRAGLPVHRRAVSRRYDPVARAQLRHLPRGRRGPGRLRGRAGAVPRRPRCRCRARDAHRRRRPLLHLPDHRPPGLSGSVDARGRRPPRLVRLPRARPRPAGRAREPTGSRR